MSTKQQPTHFAIPADLAQQILQYLGSRPYVEVAPFIAGLQQMQAIEIRCAESEESEVPEVKEGLT